MSCNTYPFLSVFSNNMETYKSEIVGEGEGRDILIEIGRIEVESLDNSSDITSVTSTTKLRAEEDPLQVLVQRKLHTLQKNLEINQPFTIFQAPPHLREKAIKMYEPKMVSIGPYHQGKETLRTLGEHKWRCLHDFLARNVNISMEVYLKEMRILEMLARECYNESVEMDGDEFALMLLLDGCFILDYYLKRRDNVLDPFSNASWSVIYSDLILLENQIPFLVIHKLASLLGDPVNVTICGDDRCPLLDLIYPLLPKQSCLRQHKASCKEVDHLLHFYYKCMVSHLDQSYSSTSSTQSREHSSLKVFPCTTILHESGMTFRRKKNPRDMFDITFNNGVLEMLLSFGGPTKILFTNVIAFEQSQYSNVTTFTSFARLLDSLIDTGNDVALLTQCNILQSFLETDREAAHFFNSLANGMGFDYTNHYFGGLFKQVIQYKNSTWLKYRATLMHDYFTNPWSSISVFAGVMLLVLTVAQTCYAIYSAYHQ